MHRRAFLASLGALTAGGCTVLPEDELSNPCLPAALPEPLASHPVVRTALDGLDTRELWDCHAHLLGTGDSGGGAWVSPDLTAGLNPVQRLQYRFYTNAACVDPDGAMDDGFVARLVECVGAIGPGARAMLLAFDYAHDDAGNRQPALSTFHVPNGYAAAVAARHPDRLEWIASVHPYRRDALTALERAHADGARAVKWLPAAMGMDPASPRCDAFYEALVRLDLPLLSHAGLERAVHGEDRQKLGNPLRLRRPLEHGVRVIVAHCASLGSDIDIDQGRHGPERASIELFGRLMDEPEHAGLLFGDVSAITQVNRAGPALETILARTDWHRRLVNGSDYPLPGVIPLFSVRHLAADGFLDAGDVQAIAAVRRHNPLLFDLVLKRTISHGGHRLPASVFESRRVFERRLG